MGKDEILDTFRKTRKAIVNQKSHGIYVLFVILLLLVFSGCSVPKIVILDDPLTPEEHINLGVAYEKQNNFDAAIKEYKIASGKLPIGYLYLGNAYFNKGDEEKAEFYYRKMIDKVPGNSDAYNNLAWLHYTRGKNLEEAEVLVLKAIELNPAQEDLYKDTLEKIRQSKR
jgi:tetratricopeptide (TPR) repeat protein